MITSCDEGTHTVGMDIRNTPPGEDFEIRCPRLGHMISFSYCRQENMGLPCFKTLDCWFRHFTVEDYLRGELSEEEWEKAFGRPRAPKVLSLVQLIEEVKKKKRNRPS